MYYVVLLWIINKIPNNLMYWISLRMMRDVGSRFPTKTYWDISIIDCARFYEPKDN